MKDLVNIIIVTFNEFEFTYKCVESVLNSNYKNIQIYLVDNGSTREEKKDFYKQFKDIKKVKIIKLKKNYGFGFGCNEAIKLIKKGYILFLNNDTEVDKNFLKPMIKYMNENSDVGACQPKIKSMQNKDYFEYAGAAGGLMDVYGYPFSRGRIFFTLEKDYGQYDDYIDLVWCSGTAMLTSKKILNKVGYFDEIFFMYGEESDLCWRINHAGFKLKFIPQSLVYHYGAGTMNKNPTYKKTFLSHRNGLILLFKNYSLKEITRYIWGRFLLDFATFFYYLFKSTKTFNWFALVLAYINFLILFPKVLYRHIEVNKLKSNYDFIKPDLYKRSIAIDYFIHNKKTYKQLYKNYKNEF